MKSGRQRRAEIQKRRQERAARREARRVEAAPAHRETSPGAVPVCVESLAPNNSYGVPSFVERGYYVDVPFTCGACSKVEVWTATQQKWWYEVAKGFVYSTATRCRQCRRRERGLREAARRVYLEGIARKNDRSRPVNQTGLRDVEDTNVEEL